MKKQYEATIVVTNEDAAKILLALAYAEGKKNCPDFEADAPILDYTANFENGFYANIELWNGEPPWVDLILFNEKREQSVTIDPMDAYFGDFNMETDDAQYILHVKKSEDAPVPRFTETVYVSKETADRINEILAIESGSHPDYDEDATIKIVTVKFPNGYEADIKLCNGDTPWVDPVLFNANGSQIGLLEPDDSFFGEYCFEVDGVEYVAIVDIQKTASKSKVIVLNLDTDETGSDLALTLATILGRAGSVSDLVVYEAEGDESLADVVNKVLLDLNPDTEEKPLSKNQAKILYDRIDYVIPLIKDENVKRELEDIRFQISCMVK